MFRIRSPVLLRHPLFPLVAWIYGLWCHHAVEPSSGSASSEERRLFFLDARTCVGLFWCESRAVICTYCTINVVTSKPGDKIAEEKVLFFFSWTIAVFKHTHVAIRVFVEIMTQVIICIVQSLPAYYTYGKFRADDADTNIFCGAVSLCTCNI
jgi:hypothetical protein